MIEKKYILTAKNYFLKRKLFFLFAASCAVMIGIVSFSFIPRNHSAIRQSKQRETKQVAGITVAVTPQPTDTTNEQLTTNTIMNPTKIPTPTPIPTQKTNNPTPTSSNTSASQHQAIVQPTATKEQTPSSTPTIQPSPTPTATSNSVTLQINEPDGNTDNSVKLNNGANTCDVLTEAKNEGKIKSLTLDDSYMSTFHSMYVREMNGYLNNWTFSVNGTSPQGCSLYTPKPNDTIVWKFN